MERRASSPVEPPKYREGYGLMTEPESKSNHLGLSIVIGIAIGTLAAIFSGHVAVWLVAGIFVGIATGASLGRKRCPQCEARKQLRAGS